MSKSGLAIVAAAGVVVASAGGFLALRVSPADRQTPPIAANANQEQGKQKPAAAAEAATPAQAPATPRSVAAAPKPVASSSSPVESRRAQSAEQLPSGSTRPGSPSLEGEPRPASAPTPTPVPSTAPPDVPAAATAPPATTPVAPPPAPRFEELTIAADSVIGVRLDAAVSSETAHVEDKVTARISRDVTVDGRTAIPAGARLEGNVVLVERGGKFKERSRLGVRFTTLVVGDGATRLPIQTEAIFRDGESPTGEATSKIGASAVVGALLGAVIGGKKGAAIGSTAGAAGGAAAVAAGGRNEAVLPAGAPVTVRLTGPVTVLIERDSGG